VNSCRRVIAFGMATPRERIPVISDQAAERAASSAAENHLKAGWRYGVEPSVLAGLRLTWRRANPENMESNAVNNTGGA